MKRVGAVIVFKDGVTKEEADRLLATITEPAQFFSTYTEEFDDDLGSPVFYIP